MTASNETYEIRSAMHPFPYTIGAQQNLKTAQQVMREHNVRHLPVMSGGELKGILSDRDINFSLRIEAKEPEELKVGEACTPEPYVVDVATSVAEVSSRMAQEHIGCALVTESGKLVGIFTTVDACRVLAEVLSGRLEQ